MTLDEEVAAARACLRRAGIDAREAALDAELLARHVLGWDRAQLLTNGRVAPPPGFSAEFDTLVERRERREPVAYVIGRREFWNREFEAGPGVLVPRPETELIVEEALARVTRGTHGRLARPLLVADVGTGSGCLAITLALELARATVVATDTSPVALTVARRNAARHDAVERVEFHETNLLAAVDRRFDLIVSNPPYVPTRDLPSLPPEVRDFEPREALDGGPDGLDVVRELLLQAESRLLDDGLLVFEFGFGQDAAVRHAIAARPAFRLETVSHDLQGIPRTAIARFQPSAS